jgi:hypothetical protein
MLANMTQQRLDKHWSIMAFSSGMRLEIQPSCLEGIRTTVWRGLLGKEEGPLVVPLSQICE